MKIAERGKENQRADARHEFSLLRGNMGFNNWGKNSGIDSRNVIQRFRNARERGRERVACLGGRPET